MTNPRRLARVQITHDVLTQMIRRFLVIKNPCGDPYNPPKLDLDQISAVGVDQNHTQAIRGILEVLIESPELPISEAYNVLPILHAEEHLS